MSNNNIKVLEKSPLFNISMGSIEAFHSDFWVWMIRQNTQFLEVFFGNDFDVSSITENKIVREKTIKDRKRLDISIMENKYVIENKIKSLPLKDQLDTYSHILDGTLKHGIITGIIPPHFMNNNKKYEKWKFLSYKEIAENIKTCYKKIYGEEISQETGDYNRELIRDYYFFIIAFNNLIDSNLKSNPDFDFSVNKELKELRIDSVYKKIKISDFVSQFNKKINVSQFNEKINSVTGWNLQIASNYTTSALADFRYEHTDGRKIGIQIQGEQYRRIVEVPENPRNNLDEIYNTFSENWLGEKKENKIQLPKGNEYETGMTKSYCKYKNNFIYTWRRIDKKTKYTDLYNCIEKDLKTAYDIIIKNEF